MFTDGKNWYPKDVIAPFNAIPLKFQQIFFFMRLWQVDSKMYVKKKMCNMIKVIWKKA